LLVSGLINKTQRQATLGPIYRLTVPDPETPRPGPCAIILRDGAGQPLAQYSFTPNIDTDPLPGTDDIQTFHALVPDRTDLAGVEITCDAQQLATRTASANPPVVGIVSPNGGERWETSSQIITWQASDADADALRSLVQYSTDDGATWATLAVDIAGTSVSFDTARLGGGTHARIRVVTTDGLLTAQDASEGSFTVVAKPPQVAIDAPAAGTYHRPGESALFTGYAWDPEDGPLPDDALSWEFDGHSDFGKGRDVVAYQLSTGAHVITLTAVDSDGLASRATRTLFVGDCAGDCNADQAVTVDEILTMVNIALGNASATACLGGDTTRDAEITVDEILAAVTKALNGCPAG
jgi:hypothetical protein